jgi:DNA-directed RNA polymerase specialized sigma24 family protein
MLEKLAQYHDEWIKIAMAFLNNIEDAQDIVQDMYLTLHRYNVTLDKIKYGDDDINRYFVYITIKNLALQHIMKRDEFLPLIEDKTEPDIIEDDQYKDILIEIDKEMESWNWYDRTLFEMYMYSGLSMRDIAYGTEKDFRYISRDRKICDHSIINGTGISLSSIYNTIKRCKERIKLKITHNTKK